jgi:hypothetical protein
LASNVSFGLVLILLKNQVIAALKWPFVPSACLTANCFEMKVSRRAAATPTFFAKETTSVAACVQKRKF